MLTGLGGLLASVYLLAMKPKVYVYRNCDTCRKAIKFLAEEGVEFQEVPIREQPPTKAELKRMLGIYVGELRRLFNTSGVDYKALNMKDKLPTLSVDEALALLNQNGNLVKRPFALTEKGGAVGFKEEEWRKLF
ncbi:MAG: ArsC family transcriptional regulator [Verrucomicrobia bacterium]|jgi:arsenate reductase|nr:ArsC family transcriptional regulator [Verrucomicrobiota bacterium]